MKKHLLLSLALLGGFALTGSAQGTITLTTAAEPGTKVKFLPNAVSALQPIEVDFGNGVKQKFTVDPKQMAYNRWVEGTIEGPTITISGNLTELTFQGDSYPARLTSATVDGMTNLTELDLSHNEIESFELLNMTPLKNLDLSYNQIWNSPSQNATLSLEYAAKSLEHLTISHNPQLQCLKIDALVNLVYLTANDCENLASTFICLPEESRPMLRSINLSNCAMSNFYPVGLPGLRSLDLANNNLMTKATDNPFVLGDYPSLVDLNVSGNRAIDALDVSKCTNLEQLRIANCAFESISTGNCPQLNTLIATNNKIESFDLGNNKALRTLNVGGNPVKELDIADHTSLYSLNISDTQISRIDLLKMYYMKEFVASGSQLEFVDFNGMQPSRMEKIDLRNCPNFTTESLSYTLWTLPAAKSSYGTNPNIFVEGTAWENADFSWALETDMNWRFDVTPGNGVANWDKVNVTLEGITDTGENKTGVLDRLYPLMGYSMPYDVDVMETTGGKFVLAQWQNPYFQTIASVHDKAIKGVPMCVYAYPEEGKQFKSVTVNGKEIKSPWFMLTEDATVKVNFTSEDNSISVTVAPGQAMSFLVNTSSANGTIWVDWGSGSRSEYKGIYAYDNTATIGGIRIDGNATGNTVTFYGDIAALDLSGFGDVAELFGLHDNHILGIDLSNASGLRFLNLHWNPITSLDLTGCPDLMVLDCGFTALKSLDLSKTPNLLWLDAYSDGFGDEEEGIAMLESLDVSNLPYLQYLDVHNNNLTSLDLSKSTWLGYLDCNGNKLTSIDVSSCTDLEELNVSRNKLTAIDLAGLSNLTDLNVGTNQLTSLDLSDCTKLNYLSFENNDIHAIDLSMLPQLNKLYINGNGMTAEELNRVYYKLPYRIETEADNNTSIGQTTWNLAVIQGLDSKENDGNRADSSIAEDRNWSPSHTGSNGGCDWSYLDIITPIHGTVEIKDAEGNVYTHGAEVPKYEPLTIVATPEEGYSFNSFSLNGELPTVGTSFDMPGIYTKLVCNFSKTSGIENVEAENLAAAGTRGAIVVKAPAAANAKVYNAAGALVADRDINGAASVALAPGIYVVSLSDGENTVAETVIVR